MSIRRKKKPLGLRFLFPVGRQAMRIPAFSRAFFTLPGIRKRILLLVLCLALPGIPAVPGAELDAPKVAVLVSQDIRPYFEAVEGITAVLTENGDTRIEVLSLDKIRGKSRDLLMARLVKQAFTLFIAIGPEAVRTVSESAVTEGTPWLYSMVLNPPAVSAAARTVCGVPLDIPARKQLEMLALGLPGVKRLGLLFDPRYNTDFFGEAVLASESFNLKIIPLEVSSKKDIPAVLKTHWGNVDAIWMIPDQTVISESIVQYIIKEALFKEKPVIGYNRFFYESGAALAFVFDYTELGRQTGLMAVERLAGKACDKAIPVFRVWQNMRVINKLGIMIPEERTPPIEVGP